MKYTHRTFLWGFPEKAVDDYHNRKLNTLRININNKATLTLKNQFENMWSGVQYPEEKESERSIGDEIDGEFVSSHPESNGQKQSSNQIDKKRH